MGARRWPSDYLALGRGGLADLKMIETATDEALGKALGGDERSVRAVKSALQRIPDNTRMEISPLYDMGTKATS